MSTVSSLTASNTASTTSTTASSPSSTTRITGMYSGLDTDSLVKDMLYSEQQKLDNIYKDEAKLQWKYESYSDIKTQLKDFRAKFMSLSSDANVYSTSAYKAFKTTMAANNYVNITTTSGAVAGSHTISSVQMATSASLAGIKHRSQSAGLTGTAGTNMIATTTGTKTLQADAGSAALADLKYLDGTSVFTFADSSDKLSFSINGKSFVIDQTETVDDMISAVNADTTAKATMTLNVNGSITIKSDNIGSTAALNLENVAGSNSLFGDSGALGIAAGAVTKSNPVATSMTLEDIAAATGKDFGFDLSGNVGVTINGQSLTFNKTQTLGDVMSAINAHATANAKMTYDTAQDQFTIRSTVTGSATSLSLANTGDGKFFDSSSPIALAAATTTTQDPIDSTNDSIQEAAVKMGINLTLDASNKFSFSVNGKSFSFDATASVASMMKTVSADTDAKATMTYSSITDSFIIQSDSTGASSSVAVANGAGVNAFGDGGFFGISSASAAGTDAELVIDGETIIKSTNSFTVDGMTFNLTGDFDSAQPESTQSAITYNLAQDIDSVIAKVKAFVTDYNSLVASLNTKVSEQPDYDYPVLSESQRSGLSESDLSKWDAKAKQGLLHNDSGISDLLTQMRTELYKKVGETGLSASQIGLSTGAWKDKGKITLDEDTLRSALQTNPDGVAEVFVGASTSKDPATIEKESGLITSFYSQMTDFENDLTKTTLKNLSEKLSTDKTKYSDQVEKMQKKQEEYYNQFTRMETALSQYNAQMGWLSSQFGLGA